MLRPLLHSKKHFSPETDNRPEFLFSRPLITTEHKISHDTSHLRYRAARRIETSFNHDFKLSASTEKLTPSAEAELVDLFPRETDFQPPKPGSSSLSSKSSGYLEHLSFVLYENLEINEEKKRRVFESRWGRGMTSDIGVWEDCNAPVVKIKTKEDIDFDEIEVTDVLTEDVVEACSSFLSKSPEVGLYVENKCELMKMNLKDISVLSSHRYLQYIDLACNNISNLMPLSGIPHLIYLNVARNKLNDVLRFKPPWYLTYVNLSYNQISKIDDLSEFWSIVRLDLSHNVIERIEGLHNLRYLKFLNLGYNLIEFVENLDNLNIQELNLEYNCITDFKSSNPDFGISTLPNLRTLILRHNKLSTLEFFEGVYGLRYIDLKCNKITDLLEVSHLKSLVYEVDFRGNPCTKWPSYRDVLLFSMPSVMFVDGASVTVSEKVSASTIFAPPMELIVARSVTKLMLLENLNVPNIDLHVPQFDQSTPSLIILSGPPALKKSMLAKQIADSLPDRVRYCASHTTRNSDNDNCKESSYHFVSREEFNEITRSGEFLSTTELLGNSYGFHMSEVAALVSEKKIGITHMDLHAALQMQNRYVNAKLVLVLTKSSELHRQWIQEKIKVSTWVKSSLQNLITIKVRGHRELGNEVIESARSKSQFIDEILTEIIETLDSPSVNIDVITQEIENISKNIPTESPTILPKIIETASEVEMEKKHISFRREDEDSASHSSYKAVPVRDLPASPPLVGLKIILDEQSNIIFENEEQKRERQKKKVLLHHNSLHLRMESSDEWVLDDEFAESASSDDLFLPKLHKPRIDSPEVLEQHYSDLVIKSRDIYMQYHLDNLGCFSLVVFADQFEMAYNQLVNFIYECYINQPLRKPIFSTEARKLTEAVIPIKSKAFLKELDE